LKGVRGGVERRRRRGLKPRGDERRDAPGSKVLKESRSPRERGRMGTSVKERHRTRLKFSATRAHSFLYNAKMSVRGVGV